MKVKKRKSLFIVGSVIIGITALLIVYFILIATGAIQTRQNKLVFTAGSATKDYDGTALTCGEWTLSSGELGEGFRVEATLTGAQTDVGTSGNEMTVIIYDSEDADVTDKFSIECLPGTLTVNPINLTVTSASATKVYDGEPLTAEGFTVYGTPLAGHTVDASVTGTITEAGTAKNTVVTRVYDEAGKDVTSVYSIKDSFGTLTVSPILLSLFTFSADKRYDGEPLTHDGWEWLSGKSDLLAGHSLDVKVTGTLTNAGTADNTLTVRVLDASDKDVTKNYSFANVYGKLTVTRIPITVYSGSADKLFDGRPLYCYDCGLENGNLVTGHILNYLYNTSLTYPGSIPNNVRFNIVDTHNNDVTANYEITYNFGTLTVYDPDNAVVGPGGIIDGTGNGEGGGNGSGEGGGESGGSGPTLDRSGNIATGGSGSSSGEGSGKSDYIVFLRILTGWEGTVFLRDYGYGDYNGMKWNKAAAYAANAALNPNYLASAALANDGKPSYGLEVQTVQNNVPYLTPYYAATYLTEGNDLHAGSSALAMGSQYYCNYMPFDYVKDTYTGGHTAYATLETNYSAFVGEHYLAVPASTKTALLSIAAANGLSADSKTLIADVRSYILGAAKYDMNFSFPAGTTDLAVYFLTQAKRGICQHFASAATLMYRSLGIPARYVTGFAASSQANNWTDVTSAQAHAWVEVYIDGMGWVNVEVTPGGAAIGGDGEGGYDNSGNISGGGNGGGSDEPVLLVYKTTDGIAYLRDKSYGNYDGAAWGAAEDRFDTVNPLSYIGSALSSVKFTNYMSVYHYKEGMPRFTPYYSVKQSAGSGDVHIGETYIGRDHLYSDYYIEYDYFTEGAVGVPDMYKLAEAEYNAFVKNRYLAVPDSTKREMLSLAGENGLAADSPTLIADVRDYIRSAAEYSEIYSFPSGTTDMAVAFLRQVKKGVCQHFATAATLMYRSLGIPARYVTGFVVNGDADKSIQVRAKDAHAWVEVYVAGTGWIQVEVTASGFNGARKKVTVTPAMTEKKYDGYTLFPKQELGESAESLFGKGTYYTVSITGSQNGVGQSLSTIESLAVYDDRGNDITNAYDITYQNGSLHVYYSELTIKGSSVEKEYDDTPLNGIGSTYELLDGELMPGHTFGEAYFYNSLEHIGATENVFNVEILDAFANQATHNYKINYINGTLRLTPRKLTVTTGSAEKEYDGSSLTCSDWEITAGTLLDGHKLDKVYFTGAQTEAGSSENTAASYVIIDQADMSYVSHFYEITFDCGTLTVTPRKITVTTASAEKQFDGTPLTAIGCEVSKGTLVAFDQISPASLKYLNSQTEVGECDNALDESLFAITRWGTDVTANYEVTFDYGKLKVSERLTPLPITVRPATVWKIYDGSPLWTSGGYEVVGGTLAAGDYLVVTATGSQTEVGVGTSTIASCVAYDKYGNKLPDNKYDFTFKTGQLRVYYAELSFWSYDISKIYDGSPLNGKYAGLRYGTLQPGHNYVCEFTGSRTNAGESINSFTVIIRDESGVDVTNLYRINYDFGTMEVYPCDLTVTAGSAEKPYDGAPLTCGTWELTEGTLPDGYRIDVTVEGTQSGRGKSANKVKTVVIYDAYGNDVTVNFAVERVNGTLTVR